MGQKRRLRFPSVNPYGAFLNIPYDSAFGDLYLAYIAGISAFGLVPRATLEIPGGERRLDRILGLIGTCRYSFHDLSRVELDHKRPPTPRFNMPFELGLAVTLQRLQPGTRAWFVFESRNRRLEKSLSDLGGTDVYVHDGKRSGVFRALCNALIRTRHQPNVQQMEGIYQDLRKNLPEIMSRAGCQVCVRAAGVRRPRSGFSSPYRKPDLTFRATVTCRPRVDSCFLVRLAAGRQNTLSSFFAIHSMWASSNPAIPNRFSILLYRSTG